MPDADPRPIASSPPPKCRAPAWSLLSPNPYPQARKNHELEPEQFAQLAAGENKIATIPLLINLHGVGASKKVRVRVTRTAGDDYEVRSLEPVIIHASHFDLSEGLETLRQIAGLQSIDLNVPVTFDLKLVKTPISATSL